MSPWTTGKFQRINATFDNSLHETVSFLLPQASPEPGWRPPPGGVPADADRPGGHGGGRGRWVSTQKEGKGRGEQ